VTALPAPSLKPAAGTAFTTGRKGVQRRHDPRKIDLGASRFAELPSGPAKLSPSLSDVTKPPAILSQGPAFWSPLVVFIFCLILLA